MLLSVLKWQDVTKSSTMKVSYSAVYSALLYTQLYSHFESSVRTKTPYNFCTLSSGSIYGNSSAIYAEDDRMKIRILVLQAKSFYSLITCISIVPRNILTKFSGPSALNWMDGHQSFGDTYSFHLQGRKYFLMRHMIINICEAVCLANVDNHMPH